MSSSIQALLQRVQAPFQQQQPQLPPNVTLVHPEDDLGEFGGEVEPDAQEIDINEPRTRHSLLNNPTTNAAQMYNNINHNNSSNNSKANNFQIYSEKHETVQLPEYLSESILPQSATSKFFSPIVMRRVSEALVLLNRIVLRLVLPVTCLVPGTAGFTMGLVLMIASCVCIMPVITYLLVGGWRKRKAKLWSNCKKPQHQQQHSVDDAFHFHNDASVVQDAGVEEHEDGGDEEEARGKKARRQSNEEHENSDNGSTITTSEEDLTPLLIPQTTFTFGTLLFTTEMWSLYIPIFFELCSWVIFFVAVMVRIAHEIVYPFSFWNGEVFTWLAYSLLPLASGIVYNLCAFFIPIYDITHALDANDRAVVFNDRGYV